MKLETFVDQAELMKLKLNHFDKLLLAPKRVREILTQDACYLFRVWWGLDYFHNTTDIEETEDIDD